jgi:hypothetical protein
MLTIITMRALRLSLEQGLKQGIVPRLLLLLQSRGGLVSYEDIIKDLWAGLLPENPLGAIRVCVLKLRKRGWCIITHAGQGLRYIDSPPLQSIKLPEPKRQLQRPPKPLLTRPCVSCGRPCTVHNKRSRFCTRCGNTSHRKKMNA